MTPQDLESLRACCSSEAAFEQLQQILVQVSARPQQPPYTLAQLPDRQRGAIAISNSHDARSNQEFPSLEALVVERTIEGLSATNQRLQQEISNRQWAETVLKESEQRFRALIENATDIIVILNQQGIFRYCSPSANRILGYTIADVVGRPATDFVHPEDALLIMGVLQTAVQHPRVNQPVIEYRVRHHQGHWCVFEAVATSLLDDPTVRGVVINCHDITVHKQAEAAIRQQAERERLMSAIAQRIRASLQLEDILNTTVSEVRQFLQTDRVIIFYCLPGIGGRVTAESVVAPYRSIQGVEISDLDPELIQHYRQGGNLVIHDVTEFTQFPNLRQILIRQQIKAALAVPILQGEHLWGVLVAHHFSGARQWEPLEITLQEQLATQVAIAIQQSLLYHQVQQLNTQLESQVQERTAQLQQALEFESMLKRITDAVRDSLDEAKILSTAVQELGQALNVAGCDAALYNHVEQTSTICYEYICSNLPTAKGSTVDISLFSDIYQQLADWQYLQCCLIFPSPVRPSLDRYAALACLMVSEQDVLGDLWLFRAADTAFTDLEVRVARQVANQCAIAIRQARLFQAAQAQVTVLEEVNRLKDDFLNTVSHELRTPISNMKMTIHLLKNNSTPERQQRYFDILQSECDREIDLINDLLDLQRLEAAHHPLAMDAIDLNAFLLTITEPFHSRLGTCQQIFSFQVPPDLPMVITDKVSLERIFAELLNNACKYTAAEGKVMMAVELAPTSQPELQCCIRNQAEIPTAELPRIFEKFYRVPDGDRRNQGGTGLGLALVRRLAEQMGGTIAVESAEGWTTFTVRLPVEIAPSLPQKSASTHLEEERAIDSK
jgi:PAS domain S-box-containing protein